MESRDVKTVFLTQLVIGCQTTWRHMSCGWSLAEDLT